MFKIISIDGGGVYGILSLCLINRILKKYPDLIDKTDMITGNSIGSLIAVALAANKPTQEIIDQFDDLAKQIFETNPTRKIFSTMGWCAKYDNKNFKKILQDNFGDIKLKDLNTKMLIPAFDLCKKNPGRVPNWKAKFFHNMGGNDDREEYVVDAILKSTAAPLFFPSYKGYVDGFFISNNPALCAVAQTQDARNEGDNPSLDEVCVISVGTKEIFSICGGRHDWGYIKWAYPFMYLMLTKDEGVVNYQCDKFLGKRYKRMEVEVPDNMVVRMDDVTIIKDFIELAENMEIRDDFFKWIDQYWI